MKRIKMLIPLKGISTGARTIEVSTDGFTGEACRTATAALEKALGTVTNEELTAEYYSEPPQMERQTEGE